MFDVLLARLQQKHRTMPYPDAPAPKLPERFQGRPVVAVEACPAQCRRCMEACPTQALSRGTTVSLDLGRCLFCGACAAACERIRFTDEYRMAAGEREALVVGADAYGLADALDGRIKRLLGRSLKLRQVSAGGCNACEADTNVLSTVGWDLGRFGIQFVASPRHADGLLITGPVPENMREGLLKTYAAVPSPKVVIVVGACAISGGAFAGHPEVHDGASRLVPVDCFIPGCPPHPLTILDGLLRLIGRVADGATGR